MKEAMCVALMGLLVHQAVADPEMNNLRIVTTASTQMCPSKITEACSSKGGFCVHEPFQDNCGNGTLKERACTSKYCQCCIPAPGPPSCDGKITNKCKQKGGACVTAPFKTNCDGKLSKKLCKGKYCQCCIPIKAPSCEGKITNICTNKGGSCVLAPFEDNCKAGKLYAKACTGKDCQCCVPEKAPSCEGKLLNSCVKKGGHCVLAPFQDNCRGKLIERACTGPNCQCCIPDTTPAPTAAPTQAQTPAPTKVQTNAATKPPPTQAQTQPPTPAPTTAQTQPQTPAQTKPQTPAPTQLPTQQPTPAQTSAQTQPPTPAQTTPAPPKPTTPAPTQAQTQPPTPAPTTPAQPKTTTPAPTTPPPPKPTTPAPTQAQTQPPTPAPTTPAQPKPTTPAPTTPPPSKPTTPAPTQALTQPPTPAQTTPTPPKPTTLAPTTLGGEITPAPTTPSPPKSTAHIPKPTTTIASKAGSSCPMDFSLQGSQCLYVNTADLFSWDEARDICATKGASLHVPADFEEFKEFADANYRGKQFWLGASDIEIEGNWTWVNGESLQSDFPWGNSQPDNWYNEDCLMYPHQSTEFNDLDCTNKLHYICESKACPTGYKLVGQQCMSFNTEEELTWQEARDNCEAKGDNLAVAKDFPALQKYLEENYAKVVKEVNWDIYGLELGATSQWSNTYAPIKALSEGGYWHPEHGSSLPQTIWFKYAQAINIKKYTFTGKNKDHVPKEYIFFGSNSDNCTDESAWTTLIEKTSDSSFIDPTEDYVHNNAKFTCYGFKITKSKDATYTSLKNLRLYAPENELIKVDWNTYGSDLGSTSQWSSGYTAIEAFSEYGHWHPAHDSSLESLPQTIWFKYAPAINIKKYSFTAKNTLQLPTEYIFFGSNSDDCNDESSWTSLVKHTPDSPFVDPAVEYVDNNQAFTCYGFKISKSNKDKKFTSLRQLSFYALDANIIKVDWNTYGSDLGSTSQWSSGYTAVETFSENGYWYPAHDSSLESQPQTIWFKYAPAISINKYSFTAKNTLQVPTEYIFFGSKSDDCTDESAWTTLVEKTPDSPFVDPAVEFVVNNQAFTCYGFKITKSNKDKKFTSLRQLSFYALDAGIQEVDFNIFGKEKGATSEWNSNYEPEQAFSEVGHWHPAHDTSLESQPQTIWFKYAPAINIKKYSFTAKNTLQLPTEYIFFGSNADNCTDESSWTTLVERTSDSPFVDPAVEYVDNNQAFNCYGFKISKSNKDKKYTSLRKLTFYALDADDTDRALFWLGARKTQSQGWEWVNGEAMTNNTWAINEPNNYGGVEDCFDFITDHGYNDNSCETKSYFVCDQGL